MGWGSGVGCNTGTAVGVGVGAAAVGVVGLRVAVGVGCAGVCRSGNALRIVPRIMLSTTSKLSSEIKVSAFPLPVRLKSDLLTGFLSRATRAARTP